MNTWLDNLDANLRAIFMSHYFEHICDASVFLFGSGAQHLFWAGFDADT